MTLFRLLALSLFTLVLVGCVTAPDVDNVPKVIATDLSTLTGAREATSETRWWKHLDDETLDALIDSGLADNPSPQIALARLGQAEANLAVARAARWPSLFASGVHEGRNFRQTNVDTRSDQGSLDFTFEADLWGKRKLQISEAEQFVDQRWFEHESATLSLSAAIADTYFQVVQLRTQAELLAAQIQVSTDLEDLIEARFRLGQARASELYQQREETSALKQLKLITDTGVESRERALDVLVGQPPDAIARVNLSNVPNAPRYVQASSVEDLVRHRADIRASYASLRQSAARAGIQFAERLPTLQVSASLASIATRNESMEFLAHSLDLAIPVFTGGRLKGLSDIARYELEEQRQRYFAQWLTALEEISTLRWQYEQQEKIIVTLSERRVHAQQALDAARDRYTLGDRNYLDVLTALRGLQDVDRSLVEERRQLISLWIRSMESIGQPMCSTEPDCQTNWQI